MAPRRVAVAYSGGRDSTALLRATLEAAAPFGVEVLALHVHHGLSTAADAWLEACSAQCERWSRRGFAVGFDFRCLAGSPGRGESVEAWARIGRYRALREMALAHGATLVLLAHHRRDQAETLLLQALRLRRCLVQRHQRKLARRIGVRETLQLARRHVHRDTLDRHALAPPAHQLRATLVQHGEADLFDEVALLGQCDEVEGHHQTAARVLPAHERLHAHRPAAPQADDGLVDHIQLTPVQRLAQLGDLYVNDAFGTAHRAEASTYGIAQFAPIACAGPLLAAEIDAITKALEANGAKVVADISTDYGQVDFSAPVLKAKQSNADALFVYTNEEESARALRELKKQGYNKPIVGETTLVGQKVIELAGEAANGAVAHVGLTIDAPNPLMLKFKAKFYQDYKYITDHNGIKGYTGVFLMKAAIEKVGKVDRKAVAAALHGLKVSAAKNPGVLMDVSMDNNGDLDRESFVVEVKGGAQVVKEVLPALNAKK